jgi:hypothetical protein
MNENMILKKVRKMAVDKNYAVKNFTICTHRQYYQIMMGERDVRHKWGR